MICRLQRQQTCHPPRYITKFDIVLGSLEIRTLDCFQIAKVIESMSPAAREACGITA